MKVRINNELRHGMDESLRTALMAASVERARLYAMLSNSLTGDEQYQ